MTYFGKPANVGRAVLMEPTSEAMTADEQLHEVRQES
jgi:hypothetical protein